MRTDAQRRKDKKRKTKIKNARAQHTLTPSEWYLIRFAWDFRCAYCSKPESDMVVPIEKDCVVPIARGGHYTLQNVVPACRHCNAHKGSQKVDRWMQSQLFDYGAFSKKQTAVIRVVMSCQTTSDLPTESRVKVS